VRASAESTRVVPWTLEARLVEARCMTGAARAASGASLAHDAKAAGFLRVGRLAGAVR
jgi:hypothetical protein